MSIQVEVESLAAQRHDARCAGAGACLRRIWHIRTDYERNAARDIMARYEAELGNIKERYSLR